MTAAIIFDCFGVLATDGWLPFKKKYFGANQKLWEQASDLNKRADVGLISYSDYIREIAKMANVPEHEVRKQMEHNVPDEELFGYIEKTLKPKYKLGMLSNAGQNWLEKIFSKEHVKLFDEIALSFETGVVKPDPRAYRMIADRLGIEPNECVFIDDQERYCVVARDLGMQAIVYESFEQMKRELDSLLPKG